MKVLREIKSLGMSIGMICIILGIVLVIMPQQVQLLINTVAGIGFLIMGMGGMARSLSLKNKEMRFTPLMIVSVLTAIFGVAILINPDITMFIVGMFVAIIAIYNGIENIMYGISLNRAGQNGSALIPIGIVHLIFGGFMCWNTFATLSLIVMVIGIYLIVTGCGILASLSAVKPLKQIDEEVEVKSRQQAYDYDVDVKDFETVEKRKR